MSQNETERVKKFFSDEGFDVEYLEHEPVITSEDAAKQRGFELKQGIKAILFTNENDWIVVNVPADRKVDYKRVAEFLGWSKNKIRMASAEEVLEKTGCEIGAVPPFAHKENIKVLVDKKVYENILSGFNIGLRTKSVKIPTKYMKIVFEKVGAIEGEFTRD